jgi:hypothetical protein
LQAITFWVQAIKEKMRGTLLGESKKKYMPFSLVAVAVTHFLFRVSASFALTEGQKKSLPTNPFPSHVH